MTINTKVKENGLTMMDVCLALSPPDSIETISDDERKLRYLTRIPAIMPSEEALNSQNSVLVPDIMYLLSYQ